MRMNFRLPICCLFALALSACASGVKFTQLNPGTTSTDQELGRIFFYRTTTMGAALRPDGIGVESASFRAP